MCPCITHPSTYALRCSARSRLRSNVLSASLKDAEGGERKGGGKGRGGRLAKRARPVAKRKGTRGKDEGLKGSLSGSVSVGGGGGAEGVVKERFGGRFGRGRRAGRLVRKLLDTKAGPPLERVVVGAACSDDDGGGGRRRCGIGGSLLIPAINWRASGLAG